MARNPLRPGASGATLNDPYADQRDAGRVCSPEVSDLVQGGSPLIGDIKPFLIQLLGTLDTRTGSNYWQNVRIAGPCVLRSRPIGTDDQLSNSNFSMQYLGFLYAPGPTPPDVTSAALHSTGMGEAWIPHGGSWWFRPVRADVVPLNIDGFPVLCPEVDPARMIPGRGAANFHSHYGMNLNVMANNGGDATLPSADSSFFLYSYNIRNNLTVYVPKKVYVNNGGANWTQAGDSIVDQEAAGALLGWSKLILLNNYTRYNQWDVSPPSTVGQGLNTLCPGDVLELSGDFRYVGPILFFNLNPSARCYVTIEEET